MTRLRIVLEDRALLKNHLPPLRFPRINTLAFHPAFFFKHRNRVVTQPAHRPQVFRYFAIDARIIDVMKVSECTLAKVAQIGIALPDFKARLRRNSTAPLTLRLMKFFDSCSDSHCNRIIDDVPRRMYWRNERPQR